jgi:hypothetical protein
MVPLRVPAKLFYSSWNRECAQKKPKAFTFENPQVYPNAVDFADKIASRTGGFPSGYYVLVDHPRKHSTGDWKRHPNPSTIGLSSAADKPGNWW